MNKSPAALIAAISLALSTAVLADAPAKPDASSTKDSKSKSSGSKPTAPVVTKDSKAPTKDESTKPGSAKTPAPK